MTDSDAGGSSKHKHFNNSFGAVRLVLAALVVVQHTLVLSGNEDKLGVGIFRNASFGAFGVAGFFAVSGYLLNKSSKKHTYTTYVVHRLFRIFPGFWLSLLIVAVVLVPISTIIGGTSLKIFGHNSVVNWVLTNSTTYLNQRVINDVWIDNPYPSIVNGSLWSLLPELLCYVGLLLLSLLVVASAKIWYIKNIRTSLLTVSLLTSWVLYLIIGKAENNYIGGKFTLLMLVFTSFIAGALLEETRLFHLFNKRVMIFVGVLAISILFLGGWAAAGPVLIAVGVLSLGLSVQTKWLTSVGTTTDISYGVYLYHWPILQTLVVGGFPHRGVFTITLLGITGLVLAGVFAWFSWTVVEKRGIQAGKHFTKNRN